MLNLNLDYKILSNRRKGNEIIEKIKTALGITVLVVSIGLAGGSDLESQTTYAVRAKAVNEHFLVSKRGVEIYTEDAVTEGNVYRITLDSESDEIIRMKCIK